MPLTKLELKEWNKLSFGSFTDIQAVLGINQLKRYDEGLKKRDEIAKKYLKEINPDLTSKFVSVYEHAISYRFLLNKDFNDFEKIKTKFAHKGISVRKGVDTLLHRKLKIKDNNFLNCVKLFNSTISIPIYPSLKNDELDNVVKNINKILK